MIQTEKLCKTYRGVNGEEIHAVNDISLTIPSGGLFVLTGPSGSGKSTLLSLLGALSRPTSGSVTMNGQNLSVCSDTELARIRQKIGFVFQSFSLLPRLPVWENVTYPLVPRGLNPSARFEVAREILERLGLLRRIRDRPDQLSGGEQQRVAVARALASNPQILLADEPTSNLDRSASGVLIEILREIHRSGVTVVISTHESEFFAVASEVVELSEGKRVCPGK